MNAKNKKSLSLIKAPGDIPWVPKKPVVEQPVMQLPLQAPNFPTEPNEVSKKDDTPRGVWIIDI